MVELGKYYKPKHGKKNNYVVKVISFHERYSQRYFNAKVVAGIDKKQGEYLSSLHTGYYEPYTPTPQELIEWGETATLTNDNPNKVEVDDKDVKLRLKCLELAIMGYNTDAIDKANDFYEWITKKPNS
jgi:hypothetical protein